MDEIETNVDKPPEQEIISPTKNPNRCIVLILCIITTIAYHYCMALPSPLESYFYESDVFNLDHTQYQLFYTSFNLPAIIVTLIGGVLCDKYGISFCRLIFVFISCIGQSLIVFGCWYKLFSLMIIGRVFYGIGSNCYGLSTNALLTNYFLNAESFFSLAIHIAFGKITISLTYWIIPIIMDKQLNKGINVLFLITFFMLSGL